MSPEAVFTLCTWSALPFWLLLAVAPGWRWTDRLVHRVWIPVVLACFYAWAIGAGPSAPEGAGFDSLPAVMAAFTSPHAVLAGWIHYIVFDLFVGAWEVRDARRRGIPHAWVLPGLFLTLMLGPLGLSVYLLVRLVRTGATGLEEAA